MLLFTATQALIFFPLFHPQTLLILISFGNPIIPIIFKSFPHQNLTLIPQNPSCPNLTQRSLKILFVSLVLRHIGQRKIRWFRVFQQFLHMQHQSKTIIRLFKRFYVVKIILRAAVQEKKAILEGDIQTPHQFPRKRQAIKQEKGVIITMHLKTKLWQVSSKVYSSSHP